MSCPTIKLNNGASIPVLGLGTWKSQPGEVKSAVISALKAGYRHIDCAMAYDNECEVGEAFKECFPSVCKREEVFVTTKLWLTDFDEVEEAINVSLKKLGLSYVDLYLIHWPIKNELKCPKRDPNDYKNWFQGFNAPRTIIPFSMDWCAKTWKQLETCVEKGYTKAIGVSNFSPKRIEELLKICKIKPAMLQIEIHPGLSQQSVVDYCISKGIQVTAYSPLGSPDRPDAFKKSEHFVPLSDPTIKTIADKYKKSPAQILIKWAIQRNTIVIPKSVNDTRIKDNFNVFDFTLNNDDMIKINGLNTNNRMLDASSFFPNDPDKVKDMWE